MADIYGLLTLPFLETFTPFFIIGTIIEILISGFVFKMALKIAGSQVTLKRALLFSIIIRSINFIIKFFVPPVFYGFYILVLNSAIWILLVMNVYKLRFTGAVIVAIIQMIITFVFTVIGIPLFIQYLKLGVII